LTASHFRRRLARIGDFALRLHIHRCKEGRLGYIIVQVFKAAAALAHLTPTHLNTDESGPVSSGIRS